jgi:hypothetical protein
VSASAAIAQSIQGTPPTLAGTSWQLVKFQGSVTQWGNIRSYVVKDGHLFLSLMADGGIYEFEPIAGKTPK